MTSCAIRPLAERVAITAALFSFVAALLGPALAASSQTWSRESASFRAGSLDGMLVTPDGTLAPGPRRDELGRIDAGVLWDLLIRDGRVFAGASDGRGLLLLRRGAEPERVATLEREPELLAIEKGPGSTLYAATGPDGAVYRLDPDKKTATELYRPDARYIWDLALLADGALAVATGLPAKVVLIDPHGGTPRTLWESAETHVRCLAVGPDGRLVAGTVGSGWIVELNLEGGGFVLHEGERSEVVELVVDRDGTVWAGLTGAAKRPSGAPDAAEKAANGRGATAITVRPKSDDDGEDENGERKQDDDARAQEDEKRRAAQMAAARGGGTVVRLARGEEPTTVWSASRETPMALAVHPERGVLLGTAMPSRVWWFDGTDKQGLFATIDASQAVSAIGVEGRSIAMALSNPAAVIWFGKEPADPARWTSDVLDASARARFGSIHAVTAAKAASRVRVLARAGNTAEPGEGWTDWIPAGQAAAPPDAAGGAAELPLARFLQVRVEVDGGGDTAVSRVDVRYRATNRPPTVAELSIEPPGVALRAIPPSSIASGQLPIVTPSAATEAARQVEDPRVRWRSKRAYEPGALTVSWSAEDPDGDELRYVVDACRESGSRCDEWFVLADDLDREFYSFDSRLLSDGVYRFRVTARDTESNYAGEARSASAVSAAVAIDHTPPEIGDVSLERSADGSASIRVRARDPKGRIARAEIAATPGHWVSIPPDDGVEDGADETFTGVVALPQGARMIGVRVTDASGNVTVKQLEP